MTANKEFFKDGLSFNICLIEMVLLSTHSFGCSKIHLIETVLLSTNTIVLVEKYSRLSLTQLCITQYYHLSRPDGPVLVFSPIYYYNSTMFISTTAKSIKLITRCEKLVPLINFSVFYNS